MLPRRLDDELSPLEDEPGSSDFPIWIVTFADLMTLLLAIFLILLSFANMDIAKFQKMLGSIRGALGVEVIEPPEVSLQTPVVVSSENLEDQYLEIAESLRQLATEEGLGTSVEIESDASGVVLRILDSWMYEPGSVDMKPGAVKIFNGLAGILREYETLDVVVEGHTDSTAISSEIYPSNWELGAARAAYASRYLVTHGVRSSRVAAVGYGDSRPRVPNDTDVHRAMNRRIELRLRYPWSKVE